MAGLTAARHLVQHGHTVTLLDKGRGVGGRMATRRMTDATPPARADHGIPYVTPQTPEFQAFLNQLVEQGAMRQWPPADPANPTNAPGYAGTEGMNAVAKYLTEGLTIHTSETVVRIGTRSSTRATGWQVETESGNLYRPDNLLITIPAPQALSLLRRSGISLSDANQTVLQSITYQPCIAILVLLDQTSQIPAPGVVIPTDETTRPTGFDGWTMLIDNGQKGISEPTTATVLLNAEDSHAYFEDDLPAVGQRVLAGLTHWIPAGVIELVQVHRWRFSLPATQADTWYLNADTPFPLLFGGDGFSGPHPLLSQWPNGLESAYWSGMKMAEQLL